MSENLCASLDMAYVAVEDLAATGKKLNYWDIAAGVIIVKEAGGYVDFLKRIISSPKKNILAANANIHEELKIVSKKILSKNN